MGQRLHSMKGTLDFNGLNHISEMRDEGLKRSHVRELTILTFFTEFQNLILGQIGSPQKGGRHSAF